jgi:acyl carrier protein
MTEQEKIDFINSAFTELFRKTAPPFTTETELATIGLDSLDIVELQVEFEKKYNVEIPDPTKEIKTVGDLFELLDIKSDII